MGFFRDLVQRFLGGSDPEPPPSPPLDPEFQPEPFAPEIPKSIAPEPAASPKPAEPPKTLALDAGDFLPIARAELKSKAQATSWTLFNNVWFGRRDVIPPASDERTHLIDRAMVTHGFLSPEELAEIHRVGLEMDRARPEDQAIQGKAALAGQVAVEADRAERARIKLEKKAAAAEKKKRYAEGVAHRKATDILFLGRGVSKFLGDRESHLSALEASGLPLLSTPSELAEALGLSISRLRWLAFHAEAATRVHYVTFEVPKKSGGTRRLSAPHRSLAAAQRWILDRIVGMLPIEPEAHGFVPGRSILTNATPHSGRSVVVNLDLKDFFPSIGFRRVRSVFRRAGYSPAVATILALLCTESPRREVVYDGTTYHVATAPRGLPQGASTSPGLSNLVARRFDRRLSGLAKKLGIQYTRYADDLTFSGDDAFKSKVGYLMARVRHIAEAEGFLVNESKSRVLRRNTAQVVTGLVVNDRPGVARDEVRRLRAILHRAKTEGLDAQNRENHPNFRAWLQGKIAYVGMARPEVARRLLVELESVENSEN
jgi:retron-type reverse transcriptase